MEQSEVSINKLAFDIAGRKSDFQLHTKGFEKPIIESVMDLDLDLD